MSIAAVLGVKSRHDGYIEGGGHIASWCFGILRDLANAEAYDERFSKWRYDDLPIPAEEVGIHDRKKDK